MSATIHTLHTRPSAIGSFLRVGHTGQRRLEALHASGRLGFNRFVFDAAHIEEQADLLKLLKRSGCEIVLDPNFAEMAAIGKFGSTLARLPWSKSSGIWTTRDFARGSNANPARQIAEFAKKFDVDAILSPSHLAESPDDAWWNIDHDLVEHLRVELDNVGASDIAIDYQIISTNAQLRDRNGRASFFAAVRDLPVQNLWLRISGFGSTATGAGTRAFIESVRELHSMGLPIVADGTGGLAGLAAASFGAVAGISHGVCQKETFSASGWKRPSSGGGGGAGTRIYVPDLDRYLDEYQFGVVTAAKGGKSRVGCTDTSCCAHGVEDQVEHADSHMLTRRSRQIDDLSSVPDLRRAEHLLLEHVDPAVRNARQCARLKLGDEKVTKAVKEAKDRLIRFRDALADLRLKDSIPSRSTPLRFRGGSSSLSAVLG